MTTLMTENTAEVLLVLMILTCALLRWPHRHATNGRPIDTEGWLLLGLTSVTMLAMPIIDVLVPWLEFADLSFRDEAAWAGLALGTTALWLFWRAQGDFLHHSGGREMVAHGVYRHLRHPMYTAMLLWALAQILLLQNWLAGPAAALTFLAVYLLRMPRDEQHMLERFGHRYLEYMSRTGALLPRVFNRQRDSF